MGGNPLLGGASVLRIDTMDLKDLTTALSRMTAADIHGVATALDMQAASAAGEVDAWRVTLTIDRTLRRAHRTRVAAHAASDASHAVLRAAESHGIVLPDDEVTHVARAAAELARGMIAGPEVVGEMRLLLGSWEPLVGAGV
jgi:hypothetical protein